MADITAALAAREEITVGGRKLLVGPMTVGGLADYEAWIRQEPLRAVRPALAMAVDDAHRARLVDEAYREYREGAYSLDNDRGQAITSRFDAWVQMLWLQLRPHNPDLDVEWLRSSMTKADLDAARPVLARVNDLPTKPGETGQTPEAAR